MVEDLCKKNTDIEIHSSKKGNRDNEDDLQLQKIDAQLKSLENEFGKSSDEIAEIFCIVSGRIPKVREYLLNL